MIKVHRQTSAQDIARRLDLGSRKRRSAVRRRLAMLIQTLDGSAHVSDQIATRDLLERLAETMRTPSHARVWLALAVLQAELPRVVDVQETYHSVLLDGPLAAFMQPLLRTPNLSCGVRIVTDAVLVDVDHTAQTSLGTGIQRVARNLAKAWSTNHNPIYVGWSPSHTRMHLLDTADHARLLGRSQSAGVQTGGAGGGETIVPWRSTVLFPELVTESPRIDRIGAMLRFADVTGGAIGFDCIPFTTTETVAPAITSAFAMWMATLAHARRIATISHSAGAEYRGWAQMLVGAGLPGPDIVPIELATESPAATAEAAAKAAAIAPAGMPLVLCVGSHEPRKNHVSVLQSAEMLWREGIEFSLVFVGGNSWNNDAFSFQFKKARKLGRPVVSLTATDDETLWGLYAAAHCTVFPSLNEGFGLPITESLRNGKPVITSGFGSMREAAASGGALFVNPRRTEEIREALRTLLTDEGVYARLNAEAAAFQPKSWADYAEEVWAFLVDGAPQ